MLLCSGAAQDIDTVIPKYSQISPFTILDQISKPHERKAFLDLYYMQDPAAKRAASLAFITAFPDSWLLAQVYEIASKTNLDLGDLNASLDYGARSLRLWPENPVLLVPVANIQAKLKMFDAATRNARAALWCLERFDRPAAITELDWPAVQRLLRASAYFVLGRVEAARAFGMKADDRMRSLVEAQSDLRTAFALNQADPEITYLLALVELGLNDRSSAGEYFAATLRMHGALEPEARKQLQLLYRQMNLDASRTFGAFVDSLAPPRPASVSVPVPASRSTQASYAGSEACAVCHPGEHTAWKHTGMGRMFRDYRAQDVLGDFSSDVAVFKGESGKPAARAILDHGKHYIEMRAPQGDWIRYPVNYLIGSKWQQAYATRFNDGKIQVFPIQYNILERRWVNYWKLIDPPASERANTENFPRAVAAATYQLNCAPCHTSQLAFRNGVMNPESAEFREGGVNCEMCHGPSGDHVKRIRQSGPYAKKPDEPPVDFNKLDAKTFVEICAQCHLQSGMREPAGDGTYNFSSAGPAFYRVPLDRPYVDFSRQAFYKDGRFRMTTFIVESLVRSACYRVGQAHCGSCHDPHPADAPSNPVSLRFTKSEDEMCLQCHRSYRATQAAHSHHPLSSKGSRCVSCHMPKIMDALLFTARSHQIDDIPDAAMTVRFGKQESPNACLSCHQEKDNAWLTAQLQKWRP
jgi:predicted CXXCH cytochrome family protein